MCDNDNQPFAYFDQTNKIIYLINEYKKETSIYCLHLRQDDEVDLFQQIVCNFTSSAISALPLECLDSSLTEISK